MTVGQLLDGAADDAGAGGVGEEGEFVERGPAAERRGAALDLDGDEVGALDGLGCAVGPGRRCASSDPIIWDAGRRRFDCVVF
jgi:hypothetical protein